MCPRTELHAFLINNVKMLAKKLLPVPPGKGTRRQKNLEWQLQNFLH